MSIENRQRGRRTHAAILTAILTGFCTSTWGADPSGLRISEFLADNEDGIVDSFGEHSDWIEIWNPGARTVNTEGWFLSDDLSEPTLWPLPAIDLGAGDYMIVFASGRDLKDAQAELHANFRISRSEGDALLLSQLKSDLSIVTSSDFASYPDQYEDTSFGLTRQDGSGAVGYFSQPSPGSANPPASVLGFVADTQFSVDRGFYDDPFTVEISSATPGASIVYTIDGSWPSETNGIIFRASDGTTPPLATVNIARTTCLRAMAFKDGFEPTNVDSHTYLFPNLVLQQNGIGAPYNQAVNWGHAGPDWEMDPEIVNHPDPEVRPVPDDLKRIPTVSVTMNFDEMFGSGGIYIAGQSVEKNVSIEFINPENNVEAPNDARGFQVDGTIQIVGGTSPNRWKSDHLSMRLKFDRDLRYPVFGDEGTDRFDTLVLDAHLGEVWHYGGTSSPTVQRNRAQYARDQFAADMHQAVGGLSPHGRTVLLYINGILWGMHTLHERPDDNFAASYLGGDNDDYNVVKHNINTAVNGTLDSYRQLHALADQDLSVQANFDAVASLLDIDMFIDYIIVNYFLGNTDWGHQNWYASRNQVIPGGKWMFHSWDAENVMNFLSDNAVNRNNSGGPTNLQHDLAANAEYRLQFADRVHKYFHNGGPMTPANAQALYIQRTDPISDVIKIESARWGDNHRDAPYTRLDWIANRERLLGIRTDGAFGDYFNLRQDVVLGQLRSRGWYPDTEPPTFSQHGGRVSSDFELEMDAPTGGLIFYTTDGSDPRIPGTGEALQLDPIVTEFAPKKAIVAPNASIGSTWMMPHFDDSSWPVGTLGAGYENSANGDYVDLIDPALDFASQVSNGAFESIYMRLEFSRRFEPDFNVLQLGIRYDDGFVAYLNGVEIHRENAPGGTGSIVDWDDQATTSHDDDAAVLFATFDVSEFADLLTSGKNVLAIHALNRGGSSTDFLVWPVLSGAKIEGGQTEGVSDSAQAYIGPVSLGSSGTVTARVLNGNEWSPATVASFVVDAVAPTSSNLVVSKVHYHPANPDTAEFEAGFTNDGDFEYIELLNIGDQTVDLRGVSFDRGIHFDFDLSDVRELSPDARVVIVRNTAAFRHRFGDTATIAGEFQNGTALDNSADLLSLIDSNEIVILQFRYEDSAPWPEAPDGGGPALVLRDPTSAPDHSLPENWTASTTNGGNPGAGTPDEIAQILAVYFTPAEMNDTSISGIDADPDKDGRSNLEEIFRGSDPTQADDREGFLSIVSDGAGNLSLQIRRSHGMTSIDWFVESSEELSTWTDETQDFAATLEEGVPAPDQDTITLTSQSQAQGASIPDARFYRIRLLPR